MKVTLGMNNKMSVQLLALQEQLAMVELWTRAAKGTLAVILQARDLPKALQESLEALIPPSPPPAAEPPATDLPKSPIVGAPPLPHLASPTIIPFPVVANPLAVPPALVSEPKQPNKLELWAAAKAAGIPEDVLNQKAYLNGKWKPTKEGLAATAALI